MFGCESALARGEGRDSLLLLLDYGVFALPLGKWHEPRPAAVPHCVTFSQTELGLAFLSSLIYLQLGKNAISELMNPHLR